MVHFRTIQSHTWACYSLKEETTWIIGLNTNNNHSAGCHDTHRNAPNIR